MISKIIKGKSFKVCLTYVLGKTEAEIINSNIGGGTIDELTAEFEISRQLRPRLEKTVCHVILSLHPQEKLDDGSWQEIFDQYLDRMGFTNNQFIAVKHTDREHEHIHLIISQVRLDGSVVSNDWERIRSQIILRDIEKQYNLTPVKSSWESNRSEKTKSQIIDELETGLPAVKKQLADRIDAALSNATTIPELIEQLNRDRIQVKISRDREGNPNGISYKLDNVSVAGSRVGKAYSLPQILTRLNSAIASENNQDEKKNIGIDLIPEIIRENVIPGLTMPELIDRLKQSGVDAHVKYTRTKKVKGISFSVGNDSIQGNELGKEYSWNGLQKYLQVSFEPERDNPIIQKMRGIEPKIVTVAPPVLKSKPVSESILNDVAEEVERLRSLQGIEPTQSEVETRSEILTDESHEINRTSQIAAIARQLLDDLGSDDFVGKDYRMQRYGDMLRVERLGGDRRVILQMKGQEIEIENLTLFDLQRFTEACEERALQLRNQDTGYSMSDKVR
jgi:hypothetical protein